MEAYNQYSSASEQDAYNQYATNILMEKRARKVAEEDALRLYNRVRQLQKEEEKAQKRIQETKKKAKDIIRLRERNELVRQEKEQRSKELQLEVERQKLENLRLKEEALRNKTEQENKIYSEKVGLVQQTKEERAELERLLAESKLLARKEALEQKEAVRRAQDDARRRLEMLKLQKLQQVGEMCSLNCTSCYGDNILTHLSAVTQAQEEYERRLKEEIEAKMQKEMEIQKLVSVQLHVINGFTDVMFMDFLAEAGTRCALLNGCHECHAAAV